MPCFSVEYNHDDKNDWIVVFALVPGSYWQLLKTRVSGSDMGQTYEKQTCPPNFVDASKFFSVLKVCIFHSNVS